MPGRKNKPTALKLIAGNPGKKKLNRNEPKPQAGPPPKPAFLNALASAEWDHIVPELDRMGVIAKTDYSALAGYCMSYARWQEAEKVVEAEGITVEGPQGIKKHPAVTVANEAKREMRAFLQLFGLDPSSRSKLTVTPHEPSTETERYFG